MKIKRGTQAQILSSKLYHDNLALATDTNTVFVSNGSDLIPVGFATSGLHSERPEAGVEGRFYYETDTSVLFLDSGASWQNCSASLAETANHASLHITGGADEVDGDKIDVDWNPSNSTPTTVTNFSTSVDNLTSHLKGVDLAFVGKADTIHTHSYQPVLSVQLHLLI